MWLALSLPHREDRVSVVKNYTYDDGCEPCETDTFMREPFVVMFSSKHTGKFLEKDPAFFHRQNTGCSDSVGILNLQVINSLFLEITPTQRIRVSLMWQKKAEGRKLCFYRIHKLTCFSSFPSRVLAVRNFVLIPQHTSPDLAVKEVDALYDVAADVRKRWSTNVNPFIPKRKQNPRIKCNHCRSERCGRKDN